MSPGTAFVIGLNLAIWAVIAVELFRRLPHDGFEVVDEYDYWIGV